MAKKKGIFGKILKVGLGIGAGVLGLGVGVKAIQGIKAGTGVLSKLKGIGALKNSNNINGKNLKDNARGLLSGMTKEQRDLINAEREEARVLSSKLKTVQALINNGATPEEARSKVGLEPEELPILDGETLKSETVATVGVGGMLKNKNVWIIGGLGLLALLVFGAMKKR